MSVEVCCRVHLASDARGGGQHKQPGRKARGRDARRAWERPARNARSGAARRFLVAELEKRKRGNFLLCPARGWSSAARPVPAEPGLCCRGRSGSSGPGAGGGFTGGACAAGGLPDVVALASGVSLGLLQGRRSAGGTSQPGSCVEAPAGGFLSPAASLCARQGAGCVLWGCRR